MTKRSIAFGTALLFWLLASPSLAEDHQYTGVKDCARCHKKELIGDQYGAWKKMRHAKAFDTLKGEKAKEIAKQKGISKPPHEADECVKCHATAHGLTQAQMAKPLALEDGVQCESCHGPGADYRKKKVMADHAKAVAAGMWEPGKDAKVCTTCHNDQSPTFEGFDHKAMMEKIAHPIPKEVKGRYLEAEKAARQGG